MRQLVPALGLAAILAYAPVARAECTTPYTGDTLVADLPTLSLALRNLDDTTFGTAGKRLEAGMVCLSSSAPSPIFASAYRYIGTYRYLVLNDEAGARRWFRVALEIDATHNWDAAELDLGHPMRKLYEEERLTAPIAPTPIEGKLLASPAGSKLYLDGRPIDAAAATLDRPHILQQVGASDKSLRGSWLIEGNALPEQFLKDAALAEEAVDDKKKKPTKTRKPGEIASATTGSAVQVMVAKRERPPEKTPLILVGVAGVLGAGGVYAASYLSQQQFYEAQTTEEAEQLRQTTNTLVLASGGVLLAGLGIGYWGVILDGGAGVGVAGHF